MTLDVTNQHWADMRIYCVANGARYRLGTVTSIERASFRLPPAIPTDARRLQFLAVPVGDRQAEYLSTGIIASPGDRVVWELKHHLPLSSLYIRR